MRHPRKSARHARTMLMEACEKRLCFDATYHNLAGGALIQSWTNTSQITTNDIWTGVPSIIGYRGDNLTTANDVDPQTVIAPGVAAGDTPAGVEDVNANVANPNTFTSGGVAEIEIADPVVGFQGSGTADAPFLLIHLNTTGQSNIPVSYILRDVDGSTDNCVQQVAAQYRVGDTGNFTNIPSAYVADASTGPSLATLVTPISFTLPAACDNQAKVQIRIITTNATNPVVGTGDEMIGVDNIEIGTAALPATVQFASPAKVVNETDGSISLEVTRTGNTSGAVDLVANTTGGTATSGADYTALTNIPVHFNAGQTSVTVGLPILTDAASENAETVIVTLSGITGGVLGVPTSTTITIADANSTANVNTLLNEIKTTAPGTDNPYEYIELRGPANTTLFNTYLIGWEGKAPANAGLADYVLDLSGKTFSASGLMIVHGATGHPAGAATSVVDTRLDGADTFENDSLTLGLYFSPAPLVQSTDYDVDNDGNLDWSTVLPSLPTPGTMDSVGWTDGTAGDLIYSPAQLSMTAPPASPNSFLDGATRFVGDTTANSASAWFGGKLVGTNSTVAYDSNASNLTSNFPAGGQLTPGQANNLVTGGTLGFEFSTFTVNEDAGTATITVTRTAPTTGAVSVAYATIAGGTATPGPGNDYTTSAGTLNWADGDSGTKSFTIPIINDIVSEAGETIQLQLSSPTGGAVLGQLTATLTIADNDTVAPVGVVLSEVKSDPGTGGDQPWEYIEVRGVPGTTLNNVFVATFEGDGGTAGTGVADLVFDLSGQVIGTNGLLVIKSSNTSFTPAAGTTVVTTTFFDTGTTQSIENGSVTVGLIYSPTPLVRNTDYDASPSGDGVLDLPSGSTVLDSVGWLSQGLGTVYSTALVSITGNTTIGGATRFYGYDNANDSLGWFGGVLTGVNSDTTYSANTTFISANFPSTGALTPGVRNNILMGDADIDGAVTTTDFNILAGNFGVSSLTFNGGNFDGAGAVDSIDFGLLLGQYGKKLPAPAPVLGAVVGGAPTASIFGDVKVDDAFSADSVLA